MAGEWLLKRLTDNNLIDIAEDVQAYLLPVKSQDLEDSAQRKYGLFSANFLRASIGCLQSSDPGLISAIHTTYHCFQQMRSKVQLSQPLFLVQVLYHIFVKLSDKNILEDCLSVALYILQEVGDSGESDKTISNIITRVYHTLWNTAAKVETQPASATIAFRARHVALKFIALQKRGVDVFTQKVLIALIRYGQIMSKWKVSDGCEEDVELLTSVCDDFCKHVTDQYPEAHSSVVLIRLHQCKELWGRGSIIKAEETLDLLLQLQTQSKAASPHTYVSLSLCRACLNLSHMKQHLHDKTLVNSTWAVLAGFSEVLQQYQNIPSKYSTDELIEDMKALSILLAASFTGEVRTLLNTAYQTSDEGLDVMCKIVAVLKCQSRFHLQFCNGDLSKVQRSWAWNLQPDKTLTSMYLLQLQLLHILLHKRYAKGADLLSEAVEAIQMLEEHQDRISIKGKQEKSVHDLGTVGQKLGNVCYINEDDEKATVFYKVACKHLTGWCEEDPAKRKASIQEVCLWKCYDSLAECYRRSGKHREAMETVIQCVLVDRSHLLSAAKIWVRAKKDLLRKDQLSQETLNRSLLESVLEKDVHLELTEKRELLEKELKVYRTYRSVLHEAELKCHHDLLQLTTDKLEKAALLVEETKLLWLHPALSDQRCCFSCAKEAVELLSGQKSNIPLVATTSAEAYLWLYITGMKQFRQRIKTPAPNFFCPKPCEDSDSGEDKPAMKAKTKCAYVTVTAEQEMTCLLDRALLLWARCVSDNQLCEELDYTAITQSLHLCAVIYYSISKPLKGLECLQLVKKVSSAVPSNQLSQTADCLFRLWCEIDHPSVVSQVLEDWNCPQNLTVCLRKAQHALRLGELDECGELATDLLEKVQAIQPRTRESCLLEGAALRLLSRLTAVTQGVAGKRLGVQACSSHLAKQSLRCHTSVLHHLLGKDLNEPISAKGAQPVDMWLVVMETLLSLLHLGRVNLLTGYARRATCYLEEGLALAQALAIPRWCVCFLIELARLNSVSGCVEDTDMYLKQAREVLYANEEVVHYEEREKQASGDAPAETPDTFLTNVDTAGDCFGFASPQLEGQGELLITTIRGRGVSEQCDMLSPQLSTPGEPDLIVHPAECVCEPCSDLTSHRLFLDYLLTLSEHYLSSGAAGKVTDTLMAARDLLIKLAPKMSALVKSVSHEKLHAQTVTRPLMWLSIFHGKTSCCMAKAKLLQGERTLSLKAADEGQAWVTGCSQGMSAVVHLQAQLWLCKAQARLRLPKLTHLLTENSDVSTPQHSTLDKSQTKLKTFSLVKNLEKLILDDEEQQNVEEKNKAKIKLQPKRRTTSGRSKKKIMYVSDSDSDGEDVKTDSVKTRKVMKAHTALPKSGKAVVEESDMEDNSNVPERNISSDICEQLSNLSIKSAKSKNAKPKADEICDVHVPENSIKKSSRTRKVKDDAINAVGNTNTGNLQPKQTRRKAKSVAVMPEIVEVKKSQTCKTKSAIPLKVPVSELSPKNVFDFDTCDENVLAKGKSSSRTSKRNINTTAKSKVSKTTRARRPKTGTEIEVGRTVDEDLLLHDREFDLAVIAICEDDGDMRLSPPPHVDPVLDLGDDMSRSTSPSLKLLDLSDTLLPVSLDLDTSIELVRAGTDDEDSGRSRTTRCRTGRKKLVRDKEDTEITRASRVTKYKQQPINKSKPKDVRKTNTTSQLQSEISEIKAESPVVAPVSEMIAELEEALRLISPCPPMALYRDICQCLALQYIQLSSVKAASYLAESMAVTLRHRARCNQATQQKQLLKAGKILEEKPIGHELEFCQMDITVTLECLPKDWTVCMLSVVQSGSEDSELIITRLQNGTEPLVKRIISFTSDQVQSVLTHFTEIMEGSQKAMKISNKTEWWKIRKGLDADLQEALLRLENDCLRGWKSLLIGQLTDEDDQEVLTNIMSSVSDHLTTPLGKALISCGPVCSETELSELITELTGSLPRTSAHTDLMTETRESAEQIPSGAQRQPVILILDSLLQHLPWESIPVLRGQPVCRMPSLHHLHSQLVLEQGQEQSALRDGVDPRSTYYILNPENNLPATQVHFQKMFEQQAGWSGLTGVAPTKEQFTAALTDHQLLVYCGHGAGSKYLPGDDIQFLHCRATALLVGCSSGRLQVEGQLEPYGMMQNYFLAGCPCVVGNLWDVTDKDIDRLTEALLNSLLKPAEGKCLATLLAKSRSVCRLPYLIGCAPVVYGLPVKFR